VAYQAAGAPRVPPRSGSVVIVRETYMVGGMGIHLPYAAPRAGDGRAQAAAAGRRAGEGPPGGLYRRRQRQRAFQTPTYAHAVAGIHSRGGLPRQHHGDAFWRKSMVHRRVGTGGKEWDSSCAEQEDARRRRRQARAAVIKLSRNLTNAINDKRA